MCLFMPETCMFVIHSEKEFSFSTLATCFKFPNVSTLSTHFKTYPKGF